MEKVRIVGLDIAKNSFHTHGAAGEITCNPGGVHTRDIAAQCPAGQWIAVLQL